MEKEIKALVEKLPMLLGIARVADEVSREVGLENLELWNHLRGLVHAADEAACHIESVRQLSGTGGTEED